MPCESHVLPFVKQVRAEGDYAVARLDLADDGRRLFAETTVADMVIARDFMVERVVTCAPSEPLNAALAKMNQHGVHELPIVAEEAPRRVLAMLSRNSLGSAYQKRLASLRQRA